MCPEPSTQKVWYPRRRPSAAARFLLQHSMYGLPPHTPPAWKNVRPLEWERALGVGAGVALVAMCGGVVAICEV